mmetsp:Transcript_26643/g.44623  ORF Transcript_26643/g.44623 Transcript_26643/m.44623 type:complete len:455 (-) Transcript_26643:2272-3636(-)
MGVSVLAHTTKGFRASYVTRTASPGVFSHAVSTWRACRATFGGGLSSSRRRQKVAAVSKFFSLKKIDMAERSDNDKWMGCRLQCVKYAASSAPRITSSFSSLRRSSMRSALEYSRAMFCSSFTSSTSFRVSTTTSGIMCRSPANSFSASVNFPSVVSLYAFFRLSSRIAIEYSSAGDAGGAGASSALHPLPIGVAIAVMPGRPGSSAPLAAARSRKYGFITSNDAMPSCRLSSRIAASNEPAAACCPAMPHFWLQRTETGTPCDGATKKELSAGRPADISASGGSSRSSISQPPSSSSSSPPSAGSAGYCMPAPAPSPGSSSASSSPHPPSMSSAPTISSADMPNAPLPATCSGSSVASGAPPSKKPLVTVSSGQLSSRRIGCGGIMSLASATIALTSGTRSPRSSSSSSTLSLRSWATAVAYARPNCFVSCRILHRSRTSPRYSALWKRPMTS